MIQFIHVLMVDLINVLITSLSGEKGECTVLCFGFRGGGLGQRKETDSAVSGPHHEEEEGEIFENRNS